MTGQLSLSRALVVLGVVLLVAPALFPLQPVLHHDTSPGTMNNATMLEDDGHTVVAYENLSERGQELYVEALRNGGNHWVAVDSGAPDFSYPTLDELATVESYSERIELNQVVIERPENASLPPADEPTYRAEGVKNRAEHRAEGEEGVPAENRSVEEIRADIARHDVLATRTAQPGLTDDSALLRLLAAALGIVAIGVGGYRSTKP